MKFKACLLSGIVMLLFLSAGTKKTSLTEGYRLGDKAPGISLSGSDDTIGLSSHSGCYTLVNFWAAYDATSRVRNIQLWDKVNELDSTLVTFYSISMDTYQSVFEETLKTDKLEAKNHFLEKNGKESAVYSDFGLKKGFRNFLTDEQGVIVAVDITPEELSKKINGTLANR